MSAGSAAFTTTHRVIHRVHHDTTVVRPAAQPATTAGFAVAFQVVVGVGDGTDGGAAGHQHHAGLARRETEDGVAAFTGGQLGERAGAACHRAAVARAEFDVVHEGTERNLCQRQCISDFRSDSGAGCDDLAHFESVGSNDITLLTVAIDDQRNAGTAVRVVLDGLDGSGVVVFVAQEVDDAVHFLVTATEVAHRHLALVVAAAGSAERTEEALFRGRAGDLVECADRLIAGTGGNRFELTNCHGL